MSPNIREARKEKMNFRGEKKHFGKLSDVKRKRKPKKWQKEE